MKTFVSYSVAALAGILSAQAAITDNLVAYWNFEEGAANHAAASGGAAYDGSLLGGASIGATAKVGSGALQLNGSGAYMDVTSIVDPNQPWSVSSWYRADIAPTGDTRFFVFETSGSYPISFGLREAGNTANTNHQSFSDVIGGPVSGTHEIADNATAATWNHVILAFTPATAGETGSILVYINGALTNTFMVPVGGTLGWANGFHVGTYRDANDRWFIGSIDEVAIWDRTLSGTEAFEVFSRGSQGSDLTVEKVSVTLSASPAAAGSVTGAGVYDIGQQVQISATASPGYLFSDWEGSFIGQPASFTHTANANEVSTAIFVEDMNDDDNDGLTNYEEIVIYGTDPANPDTDGDMIPDGDEIFITGTDPKASDEALVSFVRNNLSPDAAGAIALSPLGITRDPSTGAITLSLGLSGSPNRSIWQSIDLSDPTASIVPSPDGWIVTFPAPSSTVNSYIIIGQKP